MKKQPIPKLLLTGVPGCGKTTVIIKLAELLRDRKIGGFYTREIRQAGQRSGFAIQTFSDTKGILSSIHFAQGPRVGKYRVDVEGFEALIEAELAKASDSAEVFLIDEIGKMECFSYRFVELMKKNLQQNTPVVSTVARKGSGFIAEVKTYPEIELIQVTSANRDSLPEKIFNRLKQYKSA
jgi:nucleoside-triphosphatase